MKKVVFIAALACLSVGLSPARVTESGGAVLLQEAITAFPAQTTSLEYDALGKLRKLPDYQNLRKQYSGEGLDHAQRDLALLGVSEEQLREVITASGPNGFFGLMAGNFQLDAVAKEAAKHGMTKIALEDG
jgi:hypothetical protein